MGEIEPLFEDEELTEKTFEDWMDEFEISHPIRHWVNDVFGGLCGYSASHLLLYPWLFFPWAYRHLRWAWQRVFRGWDDRVKIGRAHV